MALGRALGHDDQGGMITCMGFFIYINVNLVAYSRSVGVTRGGVLGHAHGVGTAWQAFEFH